MQRNERLHAIAEELHLAGAGGRTSEALAQRLGVSARTVKRDLSALQDSGLPVRAKAGPGGGYLLDSAAALPPLQLSVAEASAVTLALAAMPALPFAPETRAAMDKVLAVMTESQRRRVQRTGDRLWIREPDPPIKPAVAAVLDEALRRGAVAVLDYLDKTGNRSRHREVEPMGLAHSQGQWFLLAWCRRRKAGRWFPLDRVDGAYVSTELAPQRDLAKTFGGPPTDAGPLRLRETD